MTLNKPSPRLAILRAQLAAKAEAEQLQRDTMRLMALAPIRCKAPAPDAATLPLPPSYWDDLENWLKTLAPAKPAAIDVRDYGAVGNADVWHSEAPSVAGVYMTKPEYSGPGVGRLRWWDGSEWHMNHEQLTATMDEVRSMGVRGNARFGRLQWLRLIEADAPAARLASTSSADGAALVGAKLNHSVCIKAHTNLSGIYVDAGQVIQLWVGILALPQFWLPCDKDGWVTHVPTADSTCPVPPGVKFETMRRDGNRGPGNCGGDWWKTGYFGNNFDPSNVDIVAWRPIAGGGK